MCGECEDQGYGHSSQSFTEELNLGVQPQTHARTQGSTVEYLEFQGASNLAICVGVVKETGFKGSFMGKMALKLEKRAGAGFLSFCARRCFRFVLPLREKRYFLNSPPPPENRSRNFRISFHSQKISSSLKQITPPSSDKHNGD